MPSAPLDLLIPFSTPSATFSFAPWAKEEERLGGDWAEPRYPVVERNRNQPTPHNIYSAHRTVLREKFSSFKGMLFALITKP